jgi:putative molybdopterin biosynthesis protein
VNIAIAKVPEQDQFLDVIDRDEARRRFFSALRLVPLGTERVPLAAALGRVLAEDVAAGVDVPSFDRSNVDGYAVRAADTFEASEESPRTLRLLAAGIEAGTVPRAALGPGEAIAIATGGMLPRGADAVVMVEHTEYSPPALRANPCGALTPRAETEFAAQRSPIQLFVRRAVTPGANVTFAGTDIAAGECVAYGGTLLSSRETGVLAAVGAAEVAVFRRPRVAILSTGDELIAPGAPMRPGLVYDSNARIVADAVRELGGEPVELGIVADEPDALRQKLRAALSACDVLLLSGGTSKGAGDLSYRVVSELTDPGIVAHGVALKPGKPICLAASQGKPVVVLPGFPTSAIFTFHEFVAPVIRAYAGQASGLPNVAQALRLPNSPSTLPAADPTVEAELAVKVNSEIGRTEYVLVGLVERAGQTHKPDAPARETGAAPAHQDPSLALRAGSLVAYPMGKGSGSVTTFSRADGFITIDRHEEIVPQGARVRVRLLSGALELADLVVIGSHCVGLDLLLSRLHHQGIRAKFLAVGSLGGLEAAKRGECDLAGIHLLDPGSGTYNRPFLTPELELIEGYRRMQGIAYRRGDGRFENKSPLEAIAAALADPRCVMVNRHRASGTRVLIDRLLAGAQPPGYAVQPRNHNAVAAAIAQGRADWGVCIEHVARNAGLGFIPVTAERYDFAVPKVRRARPAVAAFCELLASDSMRQELARLGFST